MAHTAQSLRQGVLLSEMDHQAVTAVDLASKGHSGSWWPSGWKDMRRCHFSSVAFLWSGT